MARNNQIILDQVELTIDLLVSQLLQIRERVTKLRKDMADVSTPALGNGIIQSQELSDEDHARLLNKIEMKTRRKHS